ncbi:MAG: Nif3-like dinuclear metal center hexameric protein [Bacteroidota bacterium]
MTVRDVQEIMDAWAPPEIAWERDNVGLQVGDPAAGVRGILVALDVTEPVVAEAARRGANLIVSHHPLLFRPLRSVTSTDAAARSVAALAQQRVALFSAHTNLDFTRGGTSFALAEALGLRDVEFLHTPYRLHAKITTFVPASHVDAVAEAMSEAGAGVIGAYDRCSFRTEGTGTFRGGVGTRPAVGRRGRLERVREVRLEMTLPKRAVGPVVRAMVQSHPYEEPAYDVYPVENLERDFGMGAIGELPRNVPLGGFMRSVRRELGAHAPRFTGERRMNVRRVAVCGGSGSDLLPEALRAGADVFVTADIRYHTFHEAAGRIALVDAGHYETEFPVVHAVVRHLRNAVAARGETIGVRVAVRSTNPVRQGLS